MSRPMPPPKPKAVGAGRMPIPPPPKTSNVRKAPVKLVVDQEEPDALNNQPVQQTESSMEIVKNQQGSLVNKVQQKQTQNLVSKQQSIISKSKQDQGEFNGLLDSNQTQISKDNDFPTNSLSQQFQDSQLNTPEPISQNNQQRQLSSLPTAPVVPKKPLNLPKPVSKPGGIQKPRPPPPMIPKIKPVAVQQPNIAQNKDEFLTQQTPTQVMPPVKTIVPNQSTQIQQNNQQPGPPVKPIVTKLAPPAINNRKAPPKPKIEYETEKALPESNHQLNNNTVEQKTTKQELKSQIANPKNSIINNKADQPNTQVKNTSTNRITPKYSDLKNKLKDFKKNKEQLLQSSEQQSYIQSQKQSQAYSQINANRKNSKQDKSKQQSRVLNTAQSVSVKPHNYLYQEEEQSNIVKPSLVQNQNNDVQLVNPFQKEQTDLYSPSPQIAARQNVTLPRQSSHKNFVVNNKNIPNRTPKKVKEAFYEQTQINQLKPQYQTEAKPIDNNIELLNEIKQDKDIQLVNQPQQNQQIEVQNDKANKIEEVVEAQDVKTKLMSPETIHEVDEQHRQASIQPITNSISHPAHPAHPPSPPSAITHSHNHPNITSTHMLAHLNNNNNNNNNNNICSSSVEQITNLLQQFNARKQQYLNNAQQLSDLCASHRVQETQKIKQIQELIIVLDQVNVKLKNVIVSY